MSDPIKDYARQVAEVVRQADYDAWYGRSYHRDPEPIDDIIASVPAPEAQHHDALLAAAREWNEARGSLSVARSVHDGPHREISEGYARLHAAEVALMQAIEPSDFTTPVPENFWKDEARALAAKVESLQAELADAREELAQMQGDDKLGGNSDVQAQDKRPPCNCPRDYAQYFGDDPHNRWCPRSRNPHPEVIQAQIDAALAREREECAKLADQESMSVALYIAGRIRARAGR